MKYQHLLSILIPALSCSLNTQVATPADRSDSQAKEIDTSALVPGLVARHYPRDPEKQASKSGAYVEPTEFKESDEVPFLVRSIAPLKFDRNQNVVARGFLKVDVSGEYVFNANNFYDRNAFFIDGKLLCPYRDGERTEARISLAEGLHPIIVAGYVESRGTVTISWKPPTQNELKPIPDSRLFCNPPANLKPADTPSAKGSDRDSPSSASDQSPAAIPDDYALISVKRMRPEKLLDKTVPAYLQEAIQFSPAPGNHGIPGGILEFEVERSGLVFLIASWKYDGNSSGGWASDAVSYAGLTNSWAPLGICPWKPDHQLFVKECQKGDSYSFRTRKYNPPQPILARSVDLLSKEFESLVPVEAQDTFTQAGFHRLFYNKEYGELDRVAKQLRRENSVQPSGKSTLGLLYAAINRTYAFDNRHLTDRISVLQKWVKDHPESLTAKIALANAHATYGDFSRGTGLAYQVSDAQYEMYVKEHQKALEILSALDKARQEDPEIYAALIRSSRAIGSHHDHILKWVSRSVHLNCWHTNTIEQAANFLLPRWHGNEGDLVRLAEVTAEAAGDNGDAVYPLTVTALQSFVGSSALNEDKFDLARLRKGFVALQKKFPRSRVIRDSACYIWCLARDRDLAQKAFEDIGSDPELRVWQKTELYELWKRIFTMEIQQGSQKSLLMPHASSVTQASFLSDGKSIITSGVDGFVRVINSETLKVANEVRTFPDSILLMKQLNEDTIVAGSDRGGLFVWRWKEGQIRAIARLPGSISCLDTSNDEKLLLAGSDSGAMFVVDMSSGKTIFQVQEGLHSGGVVAEFSNDTTFFATAGKDGHIKIINTSGGQEETGIPSDGAEKTAIAISKDGSRIATGSRNGVVKVWNSKSGRLISETQAVKGGLRVTGLDFSSDGNLLAVSRGQGKYSEYGNCLILKLTSEEIQEHEIAGPTMAVWSIEFSPDDLHVIASGADWTARIFAIDQILNERK